MAFDASGASPPDSRNYFSSIDSVEQLYDSDNRPLPMLRESPAEPSLISGDTFQERQRALDATVGRGSMNLTSGVEAPMEKSGMSTGMLGGGGGGGHHDDDTADDDDDLDGHHNSGGGGGSGGSGGGGGGHFLSGGKVDSKSQSYARQLSSGNITAAKKLTLDSETVYGENGPAPPMEHHA